MPVSTIGTNGLTSGLGVTASTLSVNGNNISAVNSLGFRNRIINGNMVIDQRNAGASVTFTNQYLVDRWAGVEDTDGAMTAQQVSDAPAGFVNSLKFTTTTADASLAATQYASVAQFIEGYNTADLAWGSASAQTITISFWVKSSLTGTFGGSLRNNGYNRSYPFTYAISAANTWEQKTVTIAGDTSGTWATTTDAGIRLSFGLGVGSTYSGTAGSWSSNNYITSTGATSVIGTLSATWQITGVQLEAGSVASPFERRDYGRELMMCQRYFWRSNTSNATGIGGFYGGFHTTGTFSSVAKWPVTMRAAPTFTRGGTNDNFYCPGISATVTATIVSPAFSVDGAWTEFTSASPTAALGYTAAYNGQLSVSAEL